MTANGKRRPPRPRIVVQGGAPSEDEAAAIAAALERFLIESAQAPAPDRASRWQRAALADGVLRAPPPPGVPGSWA